MTDPADKGLYPSALGAAGALAVEINPGADHLILKGDPSTLGLEQTARSNRFSAFMDHVAPADRAGLDRLGAEDRIDLRLRLVGEDGQVRYIRFMGRCANDIWQGLIVPAGGAAAGGVARLDMETALKDGLRAGHVRAHHQPIIHLSTKALSGFEALARWNRAGHGLVEPDDFLPLADELGHMLDVGETVRTSAASDLSAWKAVNARAKALYVSANASASELSAPGFADQLITTVEGAALKRGDFRLELSETEVMADPDRAERVLKQVRAAGIMLVLDDFGTGYSSLARLDRFPFDVVKIDQYFVRAAQSDAAARSIITSVVRIAESYGMAVVAEGIETEASEALCVELGCEYGQGLRYAGALPPQDAAHAVREGIVGRFAPPA